MGLPVKTRVLLLGCDSTQGSDMVATLRFEGCDVFSTADFPETLARISAGDIDVLVLDYRSHSQWFQQLSSKLSLGEACCRTLVLADSLEQLTLASETDVDGVLIKPLDTNQVRTVVRKLLTRSRISVPIERSRSDIASFSEGLPSRFDWEINE
jgi:DNA-binding response OmpR family regulator